MTLIRAGLRAPVRASGTVRAFAYLIKWLSVAGWLIGTVLVSFSAGYSSGFAEGIVEGKKMKFSSSEIVKVIKTEQKTLNNVCYNWWFNSSVTDRILQPRKK